MAHEQNADILLAAVGRTKRKRKYFGSPKPHVNRNFRNIGRASRTPGNNKGRRAKIVSYCPECPILNMGNPEASENVPALMPRRVGKCRAGHSWHIGGECLTGGSGGGPEEKE